MAGALALPVALRLPRQPLLGFLVQAVASCLWHPYPSASHVALFLVARLSRIVMHHVLLDQNSPDLKLVRDLLGHVVIAVQRMTQPA